MAISSFADLFRAWAGQGKAISSDAISEVRRADLNGRGYFIKSYRQPGKGWRRWLGRSRCRAEWENLLLFRRWGLPTPELIAYGERWIDTDYQGLLVTAELVGTAGLDNLAEHLHQPTWRQAIFEQLSHSLAVMHRHGFAHGDLNWRNVLVTTAKQPQIYFIDCPGGRFWPWPLRAQKIAKDLWLLDKLGRQHLSRTQRLDFYKRYRGIQRLDAADKRLLRSIVNKANKSG